MSAGGWVKWFPSDFLNGVAELDAQEIGVYVVILNLIYDRGAPLTYRPAQLARRCHVRVGVLDSIVQGLIGSKKLDLENGELDNLRARKVLEMRAEKSAKASTSARARHTAPKDISSEIREVLDASAERPHDERSAILEPRCQIPDTRTQIEEDSSLRSDQQSELAVIPAIRLKKADSFDQEDFKASWKAYPPHGRNRSGQDKCRPLWQKAVNACGGSAYLLKAIQRYSSSGVAKDRGGTFVPAFHRWLGEGRYRDWLDGEGDLDDIDTGGQTSGSAPGGWQGEHSADRAAIRNAAMEAVNRRRE